MKPTEFIPKMGLQCPSEHDNEFRLYFFIPAQIAQVAWLISIALTRQLGQCGRQYRNTALI